jgi:hypothetical protein
MDALEKAAEEIVNALLPGAYTERDLTDEQILSEGRDYFGMDEERAAAYLKYKRERIALQAAVGDEAKEKILPVLRELLAEGWDEGTKAVLDWWEQPDDQRGVLINPHHEHVPWEDIPEICRICGNSLKEA